MEDNFNLKIYVNKHPKTYTEVSIPTHTRVCLEVNTHTGTLDYFINDKHIQDRVVNAPRGCILKFDVLFFIYFYLLIWNY
jgi:hypothetical protein